MNLAKPRASHGQQMANRAGRCSESYGPRHTLLEVLASCHRTAQEEVEGHSQYLHDAKAVLVTTWLRYYLGRAVWLDNPRFLSSLFSFPGRMHRQRLTGLLGHPQE